MALPERKPESERPDPPRKKTARERAESRWGVAIHRLLGAVRSLFERMGILDGVHTGVVDDLFGNRQKGRSDEHKDAEEDLGRFLFIGVPDDEGGYSTKMWIHEDAVEGFLAAGWSKIATLEDEMTEEQFAQLLAAIKAQNSEKGFWQKYGAGLGILATVLGLWFTISTLNSAISDTVSEKTAPIAKNVETLTYAVNGNPETGVKGVNERLAAIEAKLPSKE